MHRIAATLVVVGALIVGTVVTVGPFNTLLMAAERSVALALEVSGTTTPVVEPYDELLSGQVVELSAESEIQFYHYGSCETVIVKGGQISFGGAGYTIDQEASVEVVPRKCPTEVFLNQDAQVAGALAIKGEALDPDHPLFFKAIGTEMQKFLQGQV